MEKLFPMCGSRKHSIYPFLVVLLFASTGVLFGQEESRDKNWDSSFNGYLKYMQTISWSPDMELLTDNLIHNRLNFKTYYKDHWSGVLEFRNRIFYGETVRLYNSLGIDYGEQQNSYDGVLPLEFLWVDQPSFAFNTIVDRVYINYSSDKWEIRLGRQRINWGINDTWNPNDVFNTFNFLDFDYEERPGADAIRVQRYLSGQSYLDAAYKFASERENDVFGLRYGFNTNGYDIQLIAGKFGPDWTAGLGWAGNLKNAGFKGELQLFDDFSEENDKLFASFSSTVDYSFRNGIYVSGSYLYNTSGASEPSNFNYFTLQQVNAKNLMPSKHTILASGSYMFNPLFSANISSIYGFGIRWLIFFPTLSYSIQANLNLDLVGQLFWASQPTSNGDSPFQNSGNAVFARIKWNF